MSVQTAIAPVSSPSGRRTHRLRCISWTTACSIASWRGRWRSFFCCAPICSDGLLPAGNLREPLSSLRRADIIVLREEDTGLQDSARKLLGPAHTPLFWHVQRTLRFKTMEGTLVPAPPRSLAFCALARPEEFFQSLRKHGCDPLSEVCFRDHHFYTAGDMAALAGQAYARNAECFVVTAKDACKLTPDLMAILTKVAPVFVAALVTTIRNKEKSAAELTALLLRSYNERVRG